LQKNKIFLQNIYLLCENYGRIKETNKRGGIEMKLIKKGKVALTTMAITMMTTAVNATTQTVADEKLARSLGDWVTIVAEVLTFTCLIIFAVYMGRFFSIRTDKDAENDEKVLPGVRNGMMTALVGIALAQAALIVARLCF